VHARSRGVEKVLELELDAREREMLAASVQHVRDLCETAKNSCQVSPTRGLT